MMKRLVGIVAVATLVGAPALAADMAVKAPPPAPPPVANLTGFYVGLNAGGTWGQDHVNTTQFAPVPPFAAVDIAAISAAASPAIDPSGFTGGVQAGYNVQYAQTLLGLETDFEYLGLRRSTGGTFGFPSTPGTFFSTATSVSTDWLFTLRPRLGWTTNNWLIYATGGLAVGNEKFAQTIQLLAPFVESETISTTRAGWTLGGGLEYALTRNWSMRAEYLYIDYGTVGTTGTIAPPYAGVFPTSTVHPTANIARAGINYRF